MCLRRKMKRQWLQRRQKAEQRNKQTKKKQQIRWKKIELNASHNIVHRNT